MKPPLSWLPNREAYLCLKVVNTFATMSLKSYEWLSLNDAPIQS